MELQDNLNINQRVRLEALALAVQSTGPGLARNKPVLMRAHYFENFINNGFQEEETNETQ